MNEKGLLALFGPSTCHRPIHKLTKSREKESAKRGRPAAQLLVFFGPFRLSCFREHGGRRHCRCFDVLA